MSTLRIQTNTAAQKTWGYLTANAEGMSKSEERLASGFRINRAGDDAAGLAIANKFKSDISSLQVAQRNTAEATSLVQIAEGGVNSIETILERMKELATQASSQNASTQLTSLNSEFGALKSEITRITSATQYQGTALLDGSFAGTFQVGSSSSSYDQLSISLGGLTLGSLGLNSTTVSSATNAGQALTDVSAALDTVNGVLGNIGAYQNRLDYANQNIQTTIQNYQSSQSVIKDADMASEMVTFTKFQILQQAGVSMLAQANSAPQSILSLLR